MALIANGVCRFTLNGTFAGAHTWANIWDVWMGGVADADRPARCETYARLLIDAWEQNLSADFVDEVVLTGVSWVDLDSEDGSTGTATVGLSEAPPYQGKNTSAPSSSNVAILVTKNTTSARGQRSGRMYLPGISEPDTDGNNLGGGYRADLQSRFVLFLDDTTDPAAIPEEGINPTVVHTRNVGTPSNPDIVVTGHSFITTLTVQSQLATQRRRLRR